MGMWPGVRLRKPGVFLLPSTASVGKKKPRPACQFLRKQERFRWLSCRLCPVYPQMRLASTLVQSTYASVKGELLKSSATSVTRFIQNTKNIGRSWFPRSSRCLDQSFMSPDTSPSVVRFEMDYKENERPFDLSSSGRGLQQTLLLLSYMYSNRGAVLLLDEPDAHLEILRQRQIYQVLVDVSCENGNQVIAASHSEVLLNEAAGRDVVIAFLGNPHRNRRPRQPGPKGIKGNWFRALLPSRANWLGPIPGRIERFWPFSGHLRKSWGTKR